MKVSEDNDCKEQRAATTTHGIMRTLACCEEILKEKKKSSSRRSSMLDSFNSSSGSRALPSVLLNIGNDDSCDTPTVKEGVPRP